MTNIEGYVDLKEYLKENDIDVQNIYRCIDPDTREDFGVVFSLHIIDDNYVNGVMNFKNNDEVDTPENRPKILQFLLRK